MTRKVFCPDCRVELHLEKGTYGWHYVCPVLGCEITHSCHQRTKEPMGVPADKLTRKARIMAHDVFDRIWQAGSRKRRGRLRRAAYAWLADELNLSKRSCHIGRFDRDTCMKVCKLAMNMSAERLRELGYY